MEDFDWDYSSTVETNNDATYNNDLRVLDSPFSDLDIDQLLTIPAHVIHQQLASVCNQSKETINVGQVAACTQLARVSDTSVSRNTFQVTTKPTTRIVDGNQYIASNFTEYGIDLGFNIDYKLEVELAPTSDIDTGGYTETKTNISSLRESGAGPMTNAIAAASELIADIEELKQDSDSIARALEQLWGVNVDLKSAGFIPRNKEGSARRKFAEQFKQSHFLYANDNQVSQFSVTTTGGRELYVPDNHSLDHHRARYLAKLAVFLDYYSTSDKDKRQVIQNTILYYGVRNSHFLEIPKERYKIDISSSFPTMTVGWLPALIEDAVKIVALSNKKAPLYANEIIQVKELINEIGEDSVRIMISKLADALKRASLPAPGFGTVADRPAFMADIIYTIPKTVHVNYNPISTKVSLLLSQALLTGFSPGISGVHDGIMKECKKWVEDLYNDLEIENRNVLGSIAHKLVTFATSDVLAYIVNMRNKAGSSSKKTTKSDMITEITHYVGQHNSPEVNVSTFTRPWFIAFLISNRSTEFRNTLRRAALSGEIADSGTKIDVDMKQSLEHIAIEYIRSINKHINYYRDVYKSRAEVLRTKRVATKDNKAKDIEFEYLHASRFITMVEFKFENENVTMKTNDKAIMDLIMTTLKHANVPLMIDDFRKTPRNLLEELKNSNADCDAIHHLYNGYVRVERYIKWRYHDFGKAIDDKKTMIIEHKRSKMQRIKTNVKRVSKAPRYTNVKDKKLLRNIAAPIQIPKKDKGKEPDIDLEPKKELHKEPDIVPQSSTQTEQNKEYDNDDEETTNNEILTFTQTQPMMPFKFSFPNIKVLETNDEIQDMNLPGTEHNILAQKANMYFKDLVSKTNENDETTGLTAKEVQFAEEHNVDFDRVRKFNSEAIDNEEMTINELLSENIPIDFQKLRGFSAFVRSEPLKSSDFAWE